MHINARQGHFVDAYTGGGPGVMGNATKAAAAAGYKQPHVQGSRLLQNVRVRARIKERQEVASKAANLTLESYMQRCLDVANYYGVHGQAPDATTVKALELVGKASGFLTDVRSSESSSPMFRPVALMAKEPIRERRA